MTKDQSSEYRDEIVTQVTNQMNALREHLKQKKILIEQRAGKSK